MRKQRLLILLFCGLTIFTANTALTLAAERHWVGDGVGDGAKWNVAANWSSTQDGVGGAGIPTAADDVFIDGGTGDLVIEVTASCRSFTHSSSVRITSFADGSSSLTVGVGGFVLEAGTVDVNNGNTITLSGDWIQYALDATFGYGTGTVIFSGGNTFLEDPSDDNTSTHFYNVILSKGSTSTLSFRWGMHVHGVLTLTSGYINTRGYELFIETTNPGAVVATDGIINGTITRHLNRSDNDVTYYLNDAATFITGNGNNPSVVKCNSHANTSPSYGSNPGTTAAKRWYLIYVLGEASGPRTLSLSYRTASGGTDVDETNGLTPSEWTAWKGNGHYWAVRSCGTTISVDHPANSGAVTITDSTFTDTPPSGNSYWAFGNFSNVNAKVFLQGPYSGGSMSTALNTAGVIPLTEPYTASPWNYTGYESVTSIPDGVVDWVLVELRTGIFSSTKVATRAALLKSDGSVVDLDGTSPVAFAGVPAGSYYIVIRHRNHLAIMSAVTWALSGSSSLYDFTTAQTQAYGTNPMADLGSGKYGMISGDTNADGIVDATDRSAAWNDRLQTGYKKSDVSLDGIVDASDRSEIWNMRLLQTRVP